MNEQPNNETITQSSSRDLQIIEDDAFSYEGYQVVRGEFFAHTYEPSFTFNANKVSVNTACIKKLPQTDFVQILVNPDEKKLAVRPCQEDEKVHIYIDDSGNPDEIIDESVFERYESSKAGIGIGLHLCKQIIESHLGDISVTRSPLLGGLRFTITLPIQNQKKKVELEDLQ